MQKAAYYYINFCKFVASTYCLSGKNPLVNRALHILSIGCLTRIAFYSHWLSIAIITVIMATKIIANHYFPISPPQQLPADNITSPQSLADTIENATGCLMPIDIAELMLSFLYYELKGILKQTLTGHTDGIFRIIELKNGQLASASYDNIRIWDLSSHDAPTVLRGHTGRIKHIIELKNGQLASISYGNTIRIWDLRNPDAPTILRGHTSWIYRIIELKNGQLASASSDNTIRIWDLSSHDAPTVLRGHTGRIYYIIELKNGQLASASSDNTIRILGP